MKRIYFAGTFDCRLGVPFSQMLINDYRANMFGLNHDQSIMTNQASPRISDNVEYSGSFFYPWDDTNTDVNTIVESDISSIDKCDAFVAVLKDEPALGTVSELIYASEHNKDILILYKKQKTQYEMNSKYWFSITLAKMLCKRNTTYIKTVELNGLDNKTIDRELSLFIEDLS